MGLILALSVGIGLGLIFGGVLASIYMSDDKPQKNVAKENKEATAVLIETEVKAQQAEVKKAKTTKKQIGKVEKTETEERTLVK